MVKVRDVVYLSLMAVAGCLWYADRTLLTDRLRFTRVALESERASSEGYKSRLIEASNNRRGE